MSDSENKKQEARNLGEEGEELALRHLEEKGLRLLERNWRYKHLEVDLIMEDKFWIVFVEVKARGTRLFGEPESFVTREKQGRLVRAAHHYMLLYARDKEARFDIVSIVKHPQGMEILHIPSAFYPVRRR